MASMVPHRPSPTASITLFSEGSGASAHGTAGASSTSYSPARFIVVPSQFRAPRDLQRLRRLVEQDGLGLQVSHQSLDAAFAPETGLLEPSVGESEVQAQPVLADRTCADAPHDAVRRLRVVGQYRAVQAVVRLVRNADRILLVLDRDQAQDGTEDLFLRDAALVLHAGEERGLDEVAAPQMPGSVAAGDEIGRAAAVLDVHLD